MMNMSMPDQVVRLVLDPSIRRAVQSLPQHRLIQSNARFDDLLDRLAQAERDSASPESDEGCPAASAALHRLSRHPSSSAERIGTQEEEERRDRLDAPVLAPPVTAKARFLAT
jgi:hypothetical protein